MEEVVKENSPLLSVKVLHVIKCALLYLIEGLRGFILGDVSLGGLRSKVGRDSCDAPVFADGNAPKCKKVLTLVELRRKR